MKRSKGKRRRQPAPAPRNRRESATDVAGGAAGEAALAPGVTFHGPVASGFRDQQWLVERNGVFVQLPELLYRVAELANGRRTPEEIAAAVSAATGRGVSAGNVRLMIERKLVPAGIVTAASGEGGAPQATHVAAYPEATRFPLALRLRLRVIKGQWIEPVTRVLQYLYAPPLLIPLLLAVLAAHAWLYLVFDVGGLVMQLATNLALLPALLAIMIPAALFHELGHASALHYGGGRGRGIGVGLYLIYPVFYADTSDCYRLGRWARVRTDLGGFYFHLLLALALIFLYRLTGQTVLLIAVVAINLDILRQSLPIVRFDGYWLLADLTGAPDFLSHMGAFLRTVLPVPWWRGRRLPGLKGWVKVVFGVYILVTVPALIYFASLLVTNLPRSIPALMSQLLHQREAYLTAQGASDVAGMVAAGGTAVVLFLPVVGLLYIVFNIGRGLLRALWQARQVLWLRLGPAGAGADGHPGAAR